MNIKYTKEILEPIVESSLSVSEVVRKLKGENKSGSFQSHISKRIKHFNIDTSHFLGQRIGLGKKAPNRKSIEEILIKGKEVKGSQVRRALLEIGRAYVCEICNLADIWNNAPIVLQVDHINGDKKNNLPENLRFLCPNCHSQTSTFCSRNINNTLSSNRQDKRL